MNSKVIIAGTLLLSLATASWGYLHYTQEVAGKPYRVWHQERADAMRDIRRAFKPVGDMAKGDLNFSAEVTQESLSKMYQIAQTMPAHFKAAAPWGDANAAIWDSSSSFDQQLADFIALLEAHQSSPAESLEPLRTQVDQIHQSCIGCHQDYKD